MSKFKHHTHFPKPGAEQAYRFPFVCFACRKSFKYPAQPEPRVCPQCRRPMERLSRKFSAPKSTDLMQWRKVQYLVEHGFRFHTAYVPVAPGVSRSVDYPQTLQQAKAFVEFIEARRRAFAHRFPDE
jgi:hypothetical protein